MASRMKFIIIKGSADPAQSIVQDMMANSGQWHGSDAAGQAALSANNLDLGAQLMAYGIQAVRGDDGVWYVGYVGGEKLYDKYGGGDASAADPQTGIDATRLVTKVTIRGRKGSSSRRLTAKLLDDDGFGHSRLELDVEQGVHCIFYWDGQELFRGIVQRQERTKRKPRRSPPTTTASTLRTTRTRLCTRTRRHRTCSGTAAPASASKWAR